MTDRIPPSIVRDLIARALDRQPHLESRLAKAGALVQSGAIIDQGDGTWLVGSGSQAGTAYTVNPRSRTCTCPDATFRHATHQGWCAHVLCVAIQRRGMDEVLRAEAVAWGAVLCA